jgi:ribonucleoside-diphosphate reductase alpha chain
MGATATEYRWLNELSQQFLEKGYLLPGQTLDERITIISNTAEEILGIDGFAEKFKNYVQRGWYSLSTPVMANFGTNRGLPISCFSNTC